MAAAAGVDGQDAVGATRCVRPPRIPRPLRASVLISWHLEGGSGKGRKGCLFRRFRPLLLLVFHELPESLEVEPRRKEARRDIVPGRMRPKGKGRAGYLILADRRPITLGSCSASH